ncbi:Fph type histidine kinase [Mycena leptocephala]|nr:Fph type histidine kinase [Mycena leptocephala]
MICIGGCIFQRDIPAQARQLYAINKVRLLYNRSQSTARIVVRSKEDLKTPLNMTHCYLRAMSPIHIKYLENMGVRASMSVVLDNGVRRFVGARNMSLLWATRHARIVPRTADAALLSQSISRNIERLSYAQRLSTRKLINTMASDNHPTGYIVSNADDLLGLFDADFGVLVIGEAAKMLGPNEHGQEILIMAEYLRLKQFTTIQVSQAVTADFKTLRCLLALKLSQDALRAAVKRGQGLHLLPSQRAATDVHWAGNPNPSTFQDGGGRCRAWTEDQLETAGVLALVYGKFIEVWRQKENALQTTRLTNLLLSNASHEVRTPLNHIINYLEMALNGPLDDETRDNLNRSHAASKSLLFTINDLLDLTRLESGQETSFNEPFDLKDAIEDATHLYRKEAQRRNITFKTELAQSPKTIVGDAKKIRTVVQNLTANSLKYTAGGFDHRWLHHQTPAVAFLLRDWGAYLENSSKSNRWSLNEFWRRCWVGTRVVARIVEQLGGQLRVESKVDEGSRFSFLIPLALVGGRRRISNVIVARASSKNSSPIDLRKRSRKQSLDSAGEIDSLTNTILIPAEPPVTSSTTMPGGIWGIRFEYPGTAVKIDGFTIDTPAPRAAESQKTLPYLRVLIVEDNTINRTVLAKRLQLDGHTVVTTTNGQEGLDKVTSDRAYDAILMDIQMPILDGYQATERIRALEKSSLHITLASRTASMGGTFLYRGFRHSP